MRKLSLSSQLLTSDQHEAWLHSILSRIASDTLLPTAYYQQLDSDAALDARDGDADFDAAWVWQAEAIEQAWAAASMTDTVCALVEDIRRESFLAVSRSTQQHEIASYVSDDLDLIVRGRLLGAESHFLEQLWGVYECGVFPQPPLP